MERKIQKTIYEAERIRLHDKVAGARGKYTEVSVLDPGIRIERSPPTRDKGPDGRPRKPEEHYRISFHFKLQVTLSGFDQQPEYYQRLFQSISLRYLFRHGEWHYVKPRGDPAAQLQVTDETGNSKSLGAGVENIGPTPAGKLEAHVEVNDKISYQGTMTSWREGLDYEPYDPDQHCWTVSSHSTPPMTIGFGGQPSYPSHPKHHFHVHSNHVPGCNCKWRCPKHHPKNGWCIPADVDLRYRYDTAAHWQWEVNLKLNHWAPDVYQCFSRRVTIIRFVPVDDLKRADRAQRERYLHFDFAITTVARELGHGWKNLKKYILMRPDPAETRARADKGVCLAADRAHFCVAVCSDVVHWPAGQTANLQEVADEQVGKPAGKRQRYATKGKDLDDGSGEDDDPGPAQREQVPINIYINSGPGYETRETTERTRIRDLAFGEREDEERVDLHSDYEPDRGRRVSSAARLQHVESEPWPRFKKRSSLFSDRPKLRVVDIDEEPPPRACSYSEEEDKEERHHRHHHRGHHHRHRSHSPSYHRRGHHVLARRHGSLPPDRKQHPRDGR